MRLLVVAACLALFVAPGDAAGGKKKGGGGKKSVNKLRAAGDVAFSKGDVKKAVAFYSKVIKLEPSNERNYYKRYRASLRGKLYDDALGDLRKAVAINESFKAGWEHKAKIELMVGLCEDAVGSFAKLLALKPDHKAGVVGMPKAQECWGSLQAARNMVQQGQHQQAHAHFSSALNHAPASVPLLLERAATHSSMGQYFEVLADTGRALKLQKENIDALIARGDAYYRLAEHDMAMRHYRQGLHFDPEHKPCKAAYRKLKKTTKLAKKAEAAAAEGRHAEAAGLWADARGVDPSHGAFAKEALLKGAKAWMAAGAEHFDKAAAEAGQAVALDGSVAEAHSVLGQVHMAAERWQEAVNAFKAAHEREQQNGAYREELKKAEAALKQSKTKDYYKILGLKRDATPKQIKSAYRKAAIIWHPDKHAGKKGEAAAEKQAAASKKFQDIGEANEVLSDPEKKGKYDRGEDVFENQGGGGGGGGGQHFQHGGQHFNFNFGG